MAVTERFKYVFNAFDYNELYDLREDPDEMRNLVNDPRYRADCDDMRARLYEMMDRYFDPYGTNPKAADGGEAPNRYGAPRYLSRGERLAG